MQWIPTTPRPRPCRPNSFTSPSSKNAVAFASPTRARGISAPKFASCRMSRQRDAVVGQIGSYISSRKCNGSARTAGLDCPMAVNWESADRQMEPMLVYLPGGTLWDVDSKQGDNTEAVNCSELEPPAVSRRQLDRAASGNALALRRGSMTSTRWRPLRGLSWAAPKLRAAERIAKTLLSLLKCFGPNRELDLDLDLSPDSNHKGGKFEGAARAIQIAEIVRWRILLGGGHKGLKAWRTRLSSLTAVLFQLV